MKSLIFSLFLISLVGCSGSQSTLRIVASDGWETSMWTITYRDHDHRVVKLRVYSLPLLGQTVTFSMFAFGRPHRIDVVSRRDGAVSSEFTSYVCRGRNSFWTPYWIQAQMLVQSNVDRGIK